MSAQTADKAQAKTNTVRKFMPLAAAIGIASAGLALLASFVLANWAEASTFHHGIQHVLLFIAGIGVGGSGVTVLKRNKEA